MSLPVYVPPEPGTVIPVSGFGYFVASRTVEGGWWAVTDNDRCSCPAEVRICWHIKQVARHVAHLDAARRRPSAPPHPGLMD